MPGSPEILLDTATCFEYSCSYFSCNIRCVYILLVGLFPTGTFLIRGAEGEGVCRGIRRGLSLVNFLQIGESKTSFILNRRRVTVFFGKEEITPCRLLDSYLFSRTARVRFFTNLIQL